MRHLENPSSQHERSSFTAETQHEHTITLTGLQKTPQNNTVLSSFVTLTPVARGEEYLPHQIWTDAVSSIFVNRLFRMYKQHMFNMSMKHQDLLIQQSLQPCSYHKTSVYINSEQGSKRDFFRFGWVDLINR